MHRIDIWLRPGVQLLDVAGPAEVFSSASRYCAYAGVEGGYALRYCAVERGNIETAAGLCLYADTSGRQLDRARDQGTLLIPGKLDDPDTPPERGLLRRLGRWPGRVASICTGAWRLAQSGRLDGRRATTHWLAAQRMAQTFPAVEVEPDALWIQDGPVWTSAGVSAGIDLALAMVEADLGRQVALDVARLLVLYMKRPGGQSQFSAALASQRVGDAKLGQLLRWMHEHPAADQRVEALARRAGMSPRHFARVFRNEMGTTPAKKTRDLRLEHARRSLEQRRDLSLHEVAQASGYGSFESLRRHFVDALGITPGAYRQRFGRRG